MLGGRVEDVEGRPGSELGGREERKGCTSRESRNEEIE